MSASKIDFSEFIGKIIDIYEDFLTEKHMPIDAADRSAASFDFDNTAIIRDSDYALFHTKLKTHLMYWNIPAANLNVSNVQQFIAETIEILEEVLDSRSIIIINDEKDDDDDASNIYGTDYGIIQSELEDLLLNYKLVKPADIGL